MDVFSAIVEPNRRLLLAAIREQPCTVNTLAETAGLSQPAVSKHLKVLRAANLVVVHPDGQKRWYELNPDPLREVEAFLEPYQQFLSSKLDDLEKHLDAMDI